MIGIKSESCVLSKPSLVRRTSKARRCLFGPVDHEEVKKTLRQEMAKITEETNSRWNFDYTSGTPLSGKFAWEQVGEGEESVPAAYEMPNLSIKVLSAFASHLSLVQAQRNTQVNSTRPALKRKQSEITGKNPQLLSLSFVSLQLKYCFRSILFS